MGAENKNKNLNHHDHGVHHEPRHHTPAKLSLLVPPRTSMPPEAPTPPPRTTTVSVPFQWEEAPGKPRPCHTRSEPNKGSDVARTLELPPRLLFLETKVSNSMPSPTTVLDGPYVGRATSFTSSFRTPKESWKDNFGSSRWGGVKKKNGEGSFDFSSWTEDGTSKVNITRVRRRGSFSQARSQLWVSLISYLNSSYKHDY